MNRHRIRKHPSDKYALKIYQITDLHLLSNLQYLPLAEGAILGDRYYYTVHSKLSKFIDNVNVLKPDLVKRDKLGHLLNLK